jgi:hypothetical protein
MSSMRDCLRNQASIFGQILLRREIATKQPIQGENYCDRRTTCGSFTSRAVTLFRIPAPLLDRFKSLPLTFRTGEKAKRDCHGTACDGVSERVMTTRTAFETDWDRKFNHGVTEYITAQLYFGSER